jgi:type 1 fimbriae regulatory protein FimE
MTDASEINALQCAPPAAGVSKSDMTRKSPPRRRSNAESGRKREYLKPEEVDRLSAAARKSSSPIRDEALILLAFRHGYRVSELVALDWSQVHLATRHLDVKRLKGGIDSTHVLEPDEVKLLKALRQAGTGKGPVFVGREGPIDVSLVQKLVTRFGREAGLPFPVHVHQLRHSCGYAKINAGWEIRHLQSWMGHKNIAHTAHYAQLSEKAFADYFDSRGRGVAPRRHK